MKKIWVLYRTLKPLKWCQTFGRLWFLARKPNIAPILPTPQVREIKLNAGILKPNTFFPPCSFQFLHIRKSFALERPWDKMSDDKLWVYNSHYFDDLCSVDSHLKIEAHKRLISLWIDQNPLAKTHGWDSYPISIRVVNWIKWHSQYRALDERALINLEYQLTFLSERIEYHLLGNHLIANAKALIFGGIFVDTKKSKGWLTKGIKILLEQISEQILEDGGHFERSPMYQNIMIEDLLDILSVTKHENTQQINSLRILVEQKLVQMLKWSLSMSHPDGDVSFFNDAAFGIAPNIKELIFYANSLGVANGKMLDSELKPSAECFVEDLFDSGYVVVHHQDVKAILDVSEIGPAYLGAHAHADTLSFELSVDGERVVINSGTSTYAAGLLRDFERSTRAHSTVEIDGCNSSEVWSSFRVGRRANVTKREIVSQGESLYIEGWHDGYRYLYKNPTHKRRWEFSRNKLVINDWVDQWGNKKIIGRFYLHPDNSLLEEDGGIWKLITKSGKEMNIVIPSGISKSSECFYSPQFGIHEPSKCLEVILVDGYSRVEFHWKNN